MSLLHLRCLMLISLTFSVGLCYRIDCSKGDLDLLFMYCMSHYTDSDIFIEVIRKALEYFMNEKTIKLNIMFGVLEFNFSHGNIFIERYMNLTELRTIDLQANDLHRTLLKLEDRENVSIHTVVQTYLQASTKGKQHLAIIIREEDRLCNFGYLGEIRVYDILLRVENHRNYLYFPHTIIFDLKTSSLDINGLRLLMCGQCPLGWVYFQSAQKPLVESCYFIQNLTVPISWSMADEECWRLNAMLVNTESREELEAIKHLLLNGSQIQQQDKNTYLVIPVGLTLNRRTSLCRNQWQNGEPFLIAPNTYFCESSAEECISVNLSLSSEINEIHWINHNCNVKNAHALICEYCALGLWAYTKEFNYKWSSAGSDGIIADRDFLFDCKHDGQFIFYNEVCDNVNNCKNGRDEEYCLVERNNSSYLLAESDMMCTPVNDSDHLLIDYTYLKCDGKVDCKEKSDEDEERCHECVDYFYDNVCIPSNQEIQFPKNISDDTINCNSSDGKRYFSSALKCIYLKGRSGYPVGCSDMSHLERCDSFTCPYGMAKCPFSYCIPLQYIEDNVDDCMYGEDELGLLTFRNSQLQQCMRDKEQPIFVCDGKTDCANMADEINCDGNCPYGFICKYGVATANLKSNIHDYHFINNYLKVLDFTGIDIIESNFLKVSDKIFEIYLSRCSIDILEKVHNKEFLSDEHHKLYLIDLSFNNFKIIKNESMLSVLENLQFLNLSHCTKLHTIEEGGIASHYLRDVDLSYTEISFLPSEMLESDLLNLVNLSNSKVVSFDWFLEGMTVHTLDIRNTCNDWCTVKENNFKSATIIHLLYADHYSICCSKVLGSNTPSYKCMSPSDAISSCDDLLADTTKRVLLVTVAIISFLGNLLVLTYRCFLNRTLRPAYGVFVINLGLSDFIMSIYLFIIASVDIYYRDKYVIYEATWRLSPWCKIAGYLSTLSSESSTFFVFLITVDRFLVIRFPFGFYRFTKFTSVLSAAIVWSMTGVISAVPLLHDDWLIYSSNGMCLGLPLANRHQAGWTYSMITFVALNFVMLIFICMGQLAIFKAMTQPSILNDHNSRRRAQDINVAKQLFIVAMSNFLCWFPICVCGLRSISGDVVGKETYAWLLVLVLPLNSAVNPMVYTLPIIYKKLFDFSIKMKTVIIDLKN